jgi:hypothetical protein
VSQVDSRQPADPEGSSAGHQTPMESVVSIGRAIAV